MNRHIFSASLIGLLFLAPIGTSAQADGPRYVIENLGTIDGLVPTITGMNDSGQLSGYVGLTDGSGTQRAVRYSGNAWSYVPGLEHTDSAALAINAHGDLAGYQQVSGTTLSFRYTEGVGVTAAIHPPQDGLYAIATGINANGDIVGYTNVNGFARAWIARPGGDPALLPTLGGDYGYACGVNDEGQITGWSATPDSNQHAFRIEPDGSIADLHSLDGDAGSSATCAIDASGNVGGRSTTGDNTHAFVVTAGTPADLDTFGSSYSMVNAMSNGVSAGFYFAADNTQRAMAHTADGSIDLNDGIAPGSGWFLEESIAVNGKGQIAGAGHLGGAMAVFRLSRSATRDVTAPTVTSLFATPSTVTPPNKAMVPVAITATASDDRDPNPVCAATAVDGHGAPAGDSVITGALSAAVRATGGATYSFTVTCHDAADNAASSVVDVVVPRDTTAPSIAGVTANPSTVGPPNGKMVSVTVSANATDDSGETVTCSLSSVTAVGAASEDVSVTGALTALVRAVGGRTYAFGVACRDGAGNSAAGSVNVAVPTDTTAPAINSLTVSPSRIRVTRSKMTSVAVSVSASDNVDTAPACSLTSIAGGWAGDTIITGPLAAAVRSNRTAVYSLQVTCKDRAGNTSHGTVTVTVVKDSPNFDWQDDSDDWSDRNEDHEHHESSRHRRR